jgi:hypothetical protein
VALVSVIGALIMMAPCDTPAHVSQIITPISKSRIRIAVTRRVKYPQLSIPAVTIFLLHMQHNIHRHQFKLEPTLPTSLFP